MTKKIYIDHEEMAMKSDLDIKTVIFPDFKTTSSLAQLTKPGIYQLRSVGLKVKDAPKVKFIPEKTQALLEVIDNGTTTVQKYYAPRTKACYLRFSNNHGAFTPWQRVFTEAELDNLAKSVDQKLKNYLTPDQAEQRFATKDELQAVSDNADSNTTSMDDIYVQLADLQGKLSALEKKVGGASG